MTINPDSSSAPDSSASGNFAPLLLRAELLKVAYAQLGSALWANTAIATLLVFALWREIPVPQLAVWYAASTFLSLARFGLLRAYRRDAAVAAAAMWERRFLLGAVLSGVIWGSTSLWLFPQHSSAHQMLVGFVLGGMASGAVATMSPIPLAYVLFLLSALAPFVLRMTFYGDYLHFTMGLMSAVFMVVMLVTSRRYFSALRESLRLRFENVDLVGDLTQAKSSLEGSNRHLREEIEDRRTAEESLKKLNETLEQRVAEELAENREKDHFLMQQSRLAAMGEMIGNIAHQWRQPLNALGLILANIKDAYEYKELDQEYLDRTVKKGQATIQKMSSTIDDFRNFFRPNREKTQFSLNRTVTDAISLVKPTFEHLQIEIRYTQTREIVAEGFPNELSQVLLNLLNNAKDAIQQKKVTDGWVEIREYADAGDGIIEVRDNGGGINKEILPKIFDPYFSTKESGTGIGLYMSKMILENMDGEIKAANNAEGAVFTITVPVASPPTPEG